LGFSELTSEFMAAAWKVLLWGSTPVKCVGFSGRGAVGRDEGSDVRVARARGWVVEGAPWRGGARRVAWRWRVLAGVL
jgi:hypothetical protein